MKPLRNQRDLIMILGLMGVVPSLCFFLLAHKTIFLGLCLNTFLGLLPFYFAVKAQSSSRQNFRYFSAFLWLIFLPNAPYIFTDMIHVSLHENHKGFIAYLVTVLSFTGMLSWLFSVKLMLAKLPTALKHWIVFRKYGYITLCLLSGIGVAMGRFARLNSWELLYKPAEVLKDTAYMYSSPEPWILTFGMASLLYLLKFIGPAEKHLKA